MKPYQSVTNKEYQMTYDNEAIVRNAYHTAEGNVLDTRGWIGSFTGSPRCSPRYDASPVTLLNTPSCRPAPLSKSAALR